MNRQAPTEFDLLADELERRFGATGALDPWPEDAFDALARRVFAHQFASNPAFRSYCDARGLTPATLGSWRDVPAVPATAFKHVDLVSVGGGAGASAVDDRSAEGGATAAAPDTPALRGAAASRDAAAFRDAAVFRTSGTTAGPALRGRHIVPRLSLYRASLLPTFRAYSLPGGEVIPFLSLIPHPAELPDSSLSYMVGAASDAFASETHWVVSGRGELDEPRLREVLSRLAEARTPCLVLGTALALWHLLDRLEARPAPPLPEGSRVMQTGGFKGRARSVAAPAARERLARVLHVPEARIVNEYGMTELLSQLYTAGLRREVAGGSTPGGARAVDEHVPPPWLRVRALDPLSLDELPPGEEGLLSFFDLANLGSVCHVLTEDVGSVREGRVCLSGRFTGAEPRGCSRAMDELMAAVEGSR